MPISGPASYLPTTTEFITHWTSANASLGAAGPILLAKGMSVAGLTTLRTTLEAQRADVEISRNELEGTRADIETLKAALLARLNQFNGKVRSLSPGHRLGALLPKAYSVSEGAGRVLPPLDVLADVWQRYDSEVEPLKVMGGYSLADFSADLLLLKEHYRANAAAETSLRMARARRDETQDVIYQVLKQYRLRVPAEFAEGSAVLATLPRLTPLTGQTPAAGEVGEVAPSVPEAVETAARAESRRTVWRGGDFPLVFMPGTPKLRGDALSVLPKTAGRERAGMPGVPDYVSADECVGRGGAAAGASGGGYDALAGWGGPGEVETADRGD